MDTKIPAVIVTGASGFVGRALLDDLKNKYRIFAIARRSQSECNAPIHPNIAWIRADITDKVSIAQAFREIKTAGGADFLFHLAAFYEFGGEDCPEYKTTNIEGTKHILELAKDLDLMLFIYSSSIAACSFPKHGDVITEKSPPDGKHAYAWSKRECEKLIQEYADVVPSCIVRFGAIYSDWCEYPPLYMFFNTWLGSSFRSRMLGGKGGSAVPYIHIRDIITYLRQVIKHRSSLQPAQILIASTFGSTSHLNLYKLSTRYYFGKVRKEILMPKPICSFGLFAMEGLGYITGKHPFERPWMRHYIDLQLNVDNKLSTQLLNWQPEQKNYIERRIPFMIERMKSEPNAWHTKNKAALRRHKSRVDFKIYARLSAIEEFVVESILKEIKDPLKCRCFPKLYELSKTELIWIIRLFYRLLLSSVHNNNKLLILNYIELWAFSKFSEGYTQEELIRFLKELEETVVKRLEKEDTKGELKNNLYDYISLPIDFAIDEIIQQYQNFKDEQNNVNLSIPSEETEDRVKKRSQLEETIWSCLVHRK